MVRTTQDYESGRDYGGGGVGEPPRKRWVAQPPVIIGLNARR
jgi:hypothetical protein